MYATKKELVNKKLQNSKSLYKGYKGGRQTTPLIAALMVVGLTMVMLSNIHVAHAQTSPVTIYSQTSSGTGINGMFVVLEQNGYVVANGYTPITWYLNAGQTYQILADSYGQYSFSYWNTGSSSDPTTITAPYGSEAFEAIYAVGGGSSSVTVNAQGGGNSLYGMYVALEQGGSVISSGFTPISFSLVTGDTYQVVADSYGQYPFSQWSDGNTASHDTITGSGSTTLTASYSTGGSTAVSAAAVAAAPSYSSGGLGVVIPLYTYPNYVWQQVISYHQQYPSVPMTVVINPSGGPGSYDSTIASWVSTFRVMA